ncbi:hypothetical protein VARIO8X_50343 [Burkholderiales bacterium 8X]|nr:hypothetical protein VARIO8X_50343 [Burkholderiales bacterium 8X]
MAEPHRDLRRYLPTCRRVLSAHLASRAGDRTGFSQLNQLAANVHSRKPQGSLYRRTQGPLVCQRPDAALREEAGFQGFRQGTQGASCQLAG